MMKLASRVAAILVLASLVSCTNPGTEKDELLHDQGRWRATIALNDSVKLPFNFDWKHDSTGYRMHIHNAGDTIEVTDIVELRDSLKITLPVFATYLWVDYENGRMSGYFVNPDAEDYLLPFSARYGDSSRFKADAEPCCDVSGKWATQFYPDRKNPKPAIGYFEQNGSDVSGTFVTETGDYRYLEGGVYGDQFLLSTFDGNFLYVFRASVDGDTLRGVNYSGRSGFRKWLAYRDEDFALRDADSLTYLKPGYESIEFSFPSLEGEKVSLRDSRFDNKAVVVQIMGSWCPNCIDESRYLNEQYARYHEQGLEIVGLTFERASDSATAVKRARKMKRNLDIPYPILMAGYTREDDAEEALPMLNHVMSFPTAIYLNRQHEVVKIHTGFAGPSTPDYQEFVKENEKTFQKMLQKGAAQES